MVGWWGAEMEGHKRSPTQTHIHTNTHKRTLLGGEAVPQVDLRVGRRLDGGAAHCVFVVVGFIKFGEPSVARVE